MYKKVFLELGLTETDAEVFERLASLKQATPSHLAKVSGIPRENVYYVLKKLTSQGLVMQVPQIRQQTFRISNPQALKTLFEHKEKAFLESKNVLDTLVQQLETKLSRKPLHPAVRYYEGIVGMKQSFYDFLGTKKDGELLGIVNFAWPPELDQFFVNTRMKSKISLKLLIVPTDRAKKLRASDPKELRETRVLPSNLFPEGTYVAVFDDKVLMVHGPLNHEGVGIVVENKPIAQAYAAMFWMLWDGISLKGKL